MDPTTLPNRVYLALCLRHSAQIQPNGWTSYTCTPLSEAVALNIENRGGKTMETGKDIIKTISKEEANLRNMLKSIRAIEKLTENEPLNNWHKIKQEVIKIEKTLKQSRLGEFIKENVEQHIQSIKSKIPEWEKQTKKSFGQKLEDALKELGFELGGHYPQLKVLFYILEVNLDKGNVIIWYGPQQEKLDTCKLMVDVATKKIKEVHKKITQRDFNDKRFLSVLHNAYSMAAFKSRKKIGDPLPISDVLLEYVFLIQDKKFKTNPIKSNYKEYARVFFSYDLYKLKERKIENHELSLITATRAYTKRKSDFLWIPSNERGDGTYISHIKFREVQP